MSKRPANPASAIEHASLGLAALGLVILLSFPAARSFSDTFGWLPFWLMALPLSAWAVARALRSRVRAGEARPSSRVHPIGVVPRIRAPRDTAPQAVRRAA
jgi:hypothetical protein